MIVGDDPDEVTHGGHEVARLLTRIRDSNAFIDEEFDSDKEKAQEAADNPSKDVDCCLAEESARGLHVDRDIGEATHEILEGEKEDQDRQENRFLPEPDRLTLSGALRGHENFEAMQDDCFRLLCFMRMAPQGCDAGVVPSPWTTRRLIMNKPMKWQNLVRHQISQADRLNEKPAQRRSRLSARIESQEKARAKCMPSLPSCLSLSTGDIVAARWKSTWHVAVILSLFRILRKGTGAQLAVGQMERGALHSARVVFMVKDENHEGVFTCDSRSQALVLPMEAIGLRLDGENTKRKSALDCVKIFLPEASWGGGGGLI